jgi:hypothetical protein
MALALLEQWLTKQFLEQQWLHLPLLGDQHSQPLSGRLSLLHP